MISPSESDAPPNITHISLSEQQFYAGADICVKRTSQGNASPEQTGSDRMTGGCADRPDAPDGDPDMKS